MGEYRGELINENEAQERRWAPHTFQLRITLRGKAHDVSFTNARPHSLLYQTRQRSFLFDLTKLGVVDGMRLGNKVSEKSPI